MPSVLSKDTLMVVAIASAGIVVGIAVGVTWTSYKNRTQRQIAKQTYPEEIVNKTEAMRKHRYLMDTISKKFGSDEARIGIGPFREMSKYFLGTAQAESCEDMKRILEELEKEKVISVGDYTKLIDDIFIRGGFRDEDFLGKIRSTQEEIIRTLRGTVSRGTKDSTSGDQTIQQNGGGIKDGVLLYGPSDVELAVDFLTRIKEALQGDIPGLTLELYEEQGAGTDNFDLVLMLLTKYRKIYILFTNDFVRALQQLQMARMIRYDSIRKNDYRIIPIWVGNATDGELPPEFAMLTGVDYSYMDNSRLRPLFLSKMRNCILDGR